MLSRPASGNLAVLMTFPFKICWPLRETIASPADVEALSGKKAVASGTPDSGKVDVSASTASALTGYPSDCAAILQQLEVAACLARTCEIKDPSESTQSSKQRHAPQVEHFVVPASCSASAVCASMNGAGS